MGEKELGKRLKTGGMYTSYVGEEKRKAFCEDWRV